MEMPASEILFMVKYTKKPFVKVFPEGKPKYELYHEEMPMVAGVLKPDFDIRPLKIVEARFYISRWRFEFSLNNVLENTGLRTIRGGEDRHHTAFQNIVIGDYGTTLPPCARGGRAEFTLKGYKEGLGSGAFLSLLEAFLTGFVHGDFTIEATARAFILGTTKAFEVAGIFPVSKVSVLP